MPSQVKLEPKHFFASLPTLDHRTGDIWRSLPSFGLLSLNQVDGIVITPACDLANRKSETVTYLPIISIANYLGSAAYRYECWQEIKVALSRLGEAGQVAAPARYENALAEDIISVWTLLDDTRRESAAGKQVQAYIEYLANIENGEVPPISVVERIVTKKRLDDALDRLITNSLKPDVHFIPADSLHEDYSAVPKHSLVLFRYPLSLPIEILDMAQRVSADAWAGVRDSIAAQQPVASHLKNWPVKLGALRDDFLSDLISRYTSMYIRLGSRDFTPQAVAEISEKIRGA
ncbi:hypothetical protein [Xanthomonas arboricola]|uniref:hypothetical protein n=1 Tax=Xanthomonas arboricola TaxID=56448 RepID=UPI003EBB6597